MEVRSLVMEARARMVCGVMGRGWEGEREACPWAEE